MTSLSHCAKCGVLTTTSAPVDCTNAIPRTRYHSLLTTNEPPEGPDVAFIQAVISKTNGHLTRLDAEISRVREHLKQLQEERGALSRYRSENNALLSPLRRTPPEVLAEIFYCTLPSISEAKEWRRFDIERSPWVLTHVSSRWQVVTIPSPSLWSQIAIVASRISANPLSLIKTQIQRARTLKIEFSGSTRQHTPLATKVFELLSECSGR
ncbi:hypothetical protein B0H17DRAFT_1010270 [Mycena rosella]|uniref:F-box domain-containing protein n=1 Tax=Mycena rosella TaxID=1033263 RepID=A0AAD7DKU4_MYCRO|nr:hypothetical protein B0H17DRAFT_1010270 [Mycena rosella]